MAEIKTYPAKTDAGVVANSELGSEFGGLEGTLSLVTGASNGLGAETARVLAKHGSFVIMAVRNLEAGAEVKAKIDAECKAGGSKGETKVMKLDLNSLASVKAFAGEVEPVIKAKGGLDICIFNAAVMALRDREETADGFEAQLGTNHVAHSYLATFLVPHIKANGRLVAVSSIGHRRSPVIFEDPMLLKEYDRWTSYGQSKSANILMAVYLNEVLTKAGKGARAFSLHPGGILTGLQKHVTHEDQVAMGWFKEDGKTVVDGFKTIPEGASTQVYAALHKPLSAVGGAYLEDCKPSEPTPASRLDRGDAIKLWELTMGWIKEKGFPVDNEAAFKL